MKVGESSCIKEYIWAPDLLAMKQAKWHEKI